MSLVVGISGGIGSGKSTISSLFNQLGYEVIDADVMAHGVLNEKSTKLSLKSRFGDAIVLHNEEVNRKALAKIVFGDADARQFLEELIHPKIRKEIGKKVKQSTADIIVLDVPLLDSSPLLKLCDKKIFIKVPEDIRFERVSKRGWSKKEWQQREAAQMPLNEKEKTADWVIDNTRDLEEIKKDITNWILQESRNPKGIYE